MNTYTQRSTAWKNIFNDNGECQKALSRLVRNYTTYAINQCRKYGAIDKEEYQLICEKFRDSEDDDYAEAVKLANTKINTTYSSYPIFISQILRMISRDNNANIEIKKLLLEYQEFENMPRQISYYRNAWAHNRHITSNGAWSQLLVGLLTRLCEIVEDDKNKKDCKLINDIAMKVFNSDNMNRQDEQTLKNRGFRENEDSSTELIFQMLENINLRLDGFSDMLETKTITANKLVLDKKITEEDSSNKYEAPETNLTPEENLRQQLKIIRNQIEYENELNIHYPGAAANILQGSIIDDILKNRPQDIEEFKLLPNFIWAWKYHEASMEIQLRDKWEKIYSLLTKF